MRVEIWADVVCPWCCIGKARFLRALEAFPHRDRVEVVERAFQLDPTPREGPGVPVRDMLQQKYGMDAAQVDAMTERVAKLAGEEGITPFRPAENVTGNTLLAHQLIAFAGAHGKRSAAWDRLYRAYFSESRPIYTIEDLLPLAADLGLDPDAARQALAAGAHAQEVTDDLAAARELGIRGVPFFALDRQLAISGAQSAELMLHGLEQAWGLQPR